MTPKEVQLAEIGQRIRTWREDAAECRKREAEARKRADEHGAEAEHAQEMADRWEVVRNAVDFGVVPHLDGCKGPETGDVPW